MNYLLLFFEFFKVGLFSIGGGLATLPFLTDLGSRTGWFSPAEMADMLAISESTPGPMGINMASYVGFHTGGIPGSIIATLGLIAPSIIIILIIAGFLQKFRESRYVDAVFYGLRPASTALIAAAFVQVCSIALLFHEELNAAATVTVTRLIHWPALILAVAAFLLMGEKHLKKLHPIVFIAVSALAGILFKM